MAEMSVVLAVPHSSGWRPVDNGSTSRDWENSENGEILSTDGACWPALPDPSVGLGVICVS
ncbi:MULTISPECIES: hypothetical protein [Cyanophyceae]|uniref:Uncharacterized protein n=1 Tax=Leptolyngbya subtilissima DQ-A4 TaxID=2933933 RepID=A0ABV0K0S3_9CYAN|nr:hypothetical protein [Nodosilinea sp. FACHB-141]MBD2110389.1 hypothetical protein [Nodosilinea sp. FACHB-141]